MTSETDAVFPEEDGDPGYIERARADVIRGSLWTVTTTVLTLPLGLAASVLVARGLGPHGLGLFATYTAVFAIVHTVANLGWSEATVQWLASATARGALDERGDLIRRSAGFHDVFVGPASGVCAFVLLIPSGTVVAVCGFAIAWLTEVLGTSTVIMTASARNATSAQIALIVTTATQIGLVTAALASHRPGITWLVQLGFVFLGPLIAMTRLPSRERKALFRPRLSVRMPSGFSTYAVSACIGALVTALVFGRSEVLVLRANGLLAAAGVFTIVTALAGQMTGPLDSFLAPLTPIAAGLVTIDRQRAIRVFERSLRVSAIMGTLAACVLVPVGVVLVGPLYGNGFASAAPAFLVLGLVSCFQTVLGPLTAFAFATRSAAQLLRINVGCLVADAALAVATIPFIGLSGAVLANATAQMLSLVWMTRLVSRRLELRLGVIVRNLRLFGVGLLLGAAEGVAGLELSGAFQLAMLAVVGAALLSLRMILVTNESLRLTTEDVALIGGGTSSRAVHLVIVGLSRAGVIGRGE
jgi:O-antigen/teichoic acid export membrane protein